MFARSGLPQQSGTSRPVGIPRPANKHSLTTPACTITRTSRCRCARRRSAHAGCRGPTGDGCQSTSSLAYLTSRASAPSPSATIWLAREAHTFLQPAELLLHYGHAPDGDQRWWQEAQKLASLRQVKGARSIFGRPLRTAAHRADVLRLQLLIEHRGSLGHGCSLPRNVHALFDGPKDFVIGREGAASHVWATRPR